MQCILKSKHHQDECTICGPELLHCQKTPACVQKVWSGPEGGNFRWSVTTRPSLERKLVEPTNELKILTNNSANNPKEKMMSCYHVPHFAPKIGSWHSPAVAAPHPLSRPSAAHSAAPAGSAREDAAAWRRSWCRGPRCWWMVACCFLSCVFPKMTIMAKILITRQSLELDWYG